MGEIETLNILTLSVSMIISLIVCSGLIMFLLDRRSNILRRRQSSQALETLFTAVSSFRVSAPRENDIETVGKELLERASHFADAKVLDEHDIREIESIVELIDKLKAQLIEANRPNHPGTNVTHG